MGMQIHTQLDNVRKELDILSKVNHQNIIKVHEIIEDVPAQNMDQSDDEASDKIYVIMELAVYKEVMTWNENTYQFAPNPVFGCQFMPCETIFSLLADLAKALDYMHHEVGIVHRDLKPQNILICNQDDRLTAKLCDFGVSVKLQPPFDANDAMVKSAGTYHFFPPECCDPVIDEYKGRPTDMWALGVTTFCMIFNELPFWNPDINEFGILEIILKNEVTIPSECGRDE